MKYRRTSTKNCHQIDRCFASSEYMHIYIYKQRLTARHDIPRVYSPLDVSYAHERLNVLPINI